MKNLLNLGKALTKAEQQTINGGITECMAGACRGFCDSRGRCIDPIECPLGGC